MELTPPLENSIETNINFKVEYEFEIDIFAPQVMLLKCICWCMEIGPLLQYTMIRSAFALSRNTED